MNTFAEKNSVENENEKAWIFEWGYNQFYNFLAQRIIWKKSFYPSTKEISFVKTETF